MVARIRPTWLRLPHGAQAPIGGRNLVEPAGLTHTQRKEIAMRIVSCIVAAAALAATVSGCADPYYGYRRSYVAAPAYYTPTTTYYASSSYYPPTTAYYSSYPTGTYYSSKYDYYRNYNGSLHPVGPEM
jgi:hypothetical protein